MHRSRQQYSAPEPAWVVEMMAVSHALIDQGLRAGLQGMARTRGLYVDPACQQEVLALALRAALTYGIPLSASVGDVLERLTVLQTGDDVRPMAAATPAEFPALSPSAAAGGGHDDAA